MFKMVDLTGFTVQVRDSSGGGIASALVRIYESTGTTQLTYGYTNGGGDKVFYLPDATYKAKVTKSPGHPSWETFTVNYNPTSPTMSGTVDLTGFTIQVRQSDGTGVSSALVRIYESTGTTQLTYGYTNGGGDKVFYLPDDTYQAKATKSPGVASWETFAVPQPNPNDMFYPVDLTGFTIQVRESDSTGVSSALVRIYESTGTTQLTYGYTGGTGDKVFYLPDATYQAKVTKSPGRASWETFTIPQVPATDMDYEVDLTGFTIHVEDSGGNPISSALVRIYDSTGTTQYTYGYTNGLGNILFWLPDGNYRAKVTKSGSTVWADFTVGGASKTKTVTM
jgi:hypothetical protein